MKQRIVFESPSSRSYCGKGIGLGTCLDGKPSKMASMEPRLHYKKLAPEGYAAMAALEHYLNTAAGLESILQEFVRLLASHLNGCSFCVDLHTAQLKKHNETEARIASVQDWRHSGYYTQRERSALAWAEALTNIQQGHAPDPIFDDLKLHFTDAEIVNLTLTITNINAWNRLQISLGEPVPRV